MIPKPLQALEDPRKVSGRHPQAGPAGKSVRTEINKNKSKEAEDSGVVVVQMICSLFHRACIDLYLPANLWLLGRDIMS